MGLSSEAVRVVQPLLRDPGRAALLLDVDGTLAPIVASPGDVEILPSIRALLPQLRDRFGLVGFISGRGLTELEQIVRLDGCAYAGNHGMEIHPRGGRPGVAAAAVPYLPQIAAFARTQQVGALDGAGIWIENKGATLTFHYRTAPDVERARAMIDSVIAPAARAAGLVPTSGRMSLEIRPPVALDKGTAARAILAGTPCEAALAIGDDHTDVHTWDALRAMVREGSLERAIAVAVANPEAPTEVMAAADLAVGGPSEVAELLRLLVDGHADA